MGGFPPKCFNPYVSVGTLVDLNFLLFICPNFLNFLQWTYIMFRTWRKIFKHLGLFLTNWVLKFWKLQKLNHRVGGQSWKSCWKSFGPHVIRCGCTWKSHVEFQDSGTWSTLCVNQPEPPGMDLGTRVCYGSPGLPMCSQLWELLLVSCSV